MHELAVQLRDELGMLEHHLGDERARLQVTAALQLEEVALGADHGALLEPRQQTSGSGGGGVCHVAPLQDELRLQQLGLQLC